MKEELKDRLPLGLIVTVKELDATGYIYESACSEDGHTIYGVWLHKTAFPKNFCATSCWHCRREELIVDANPTFQPQKDGRWVIEPAPTE